MWQDDNNVNMEWEQILEIPVWTSLREVAPSASTLLSGIHQVATNSYLVVQPYDRDLKLNQPGAPFIAAALWATSANAAQRWWGNDPAVRVDSVDVEIPKRLLLGTTGEYGELKNSVPRLPGEISELAVYSNKGQFVHKVLQLKRFRYCFLGERIIANQKPYLIQVGLK